jgi:hypothetical protein
MSAVSAHENFIYQVHDRQLTTVGGGGGGGCFSSPAAGTRAGQPEPEVASLSFCIRLADRGGKGSRKKNTKRKRNGIRKDDAEKGEWRGKVGLLVDWDVKYSKEKKKCCIFFSSACDGPILAAL